MKFLWSSNARPLKPSLVHPANLLNVQQSMIPIDFVFLANGTLIFFVTSHPQFQIARFHNFPASFAGRENSMTHVWTATCDGRFLRKSGHLI